MNISSAAIRALRRIHFACPMRLVSRDGGVHHFEGDLDSNRSAETLVSELLDAAERALAAEEERVR